MRKSLFAAPADPAWRLAEIRELTARMSLVKAPALHIQMAREIKAHAAAYEAEIAALTSGEVH